MVCSSVWERESDDTVHPSVNSNLQLQSDTKENAQFKALRSVMLGFQELCDPHRNIPSAAVGS